MWDVDPNEPNEPKELAPNCAIRRCSRRSNSLQPV